MKICVFSDSHGNAGNMINAISREKPDLCFYLGDGVRDVDTVFKQFPNLPVYMVRGNCDLRSKVSSSIICSIGGVSIFATHGHMYDVRYEPNFDTLTDAVIDAGADVALFGHTHRQYLERNRGVMLLNPGSIGRGQYPCYAVLTIERGCCSAELCTI